MRLRLLSCCKQAVTLKCRAQGHDECNGDVSPIEEIPPGVAGSDNFRFADNPPRIVGSAVTILRHDIDSANS
ncbi:hypothetical protein SBA5_1410002 [Candidatus Sulfotelmatomonas gaucii]|uniref:Uncharacterized protein n=1 Tax=Candidatus Sulfuritelmatomonas gaucii TaxID=2043161 RepID=A0A2N9L5K9_9BACT|nr:hypothetical protein SBA5_1410002 [Candidatus Sulfotelmatomonas gaucii]